MERLSGFIFEWSVGAIERKALTECANTHFMDVIAGTKWERLKYVSNKALNGEDQRGLRGPFSYQLVCRRSGPRIAILSVNRIVVENYADRLAKEVLAIRMNKVAIDVDSLVKLIVNRPAIYSVCYANARVPAYGTSLRNAVFYGDDLGASTWFKDSASLMNFFLCGLRRTSLGNELIRLGSDGRMAFQFGEPKKVLQVEEVLSFLRREQYLSSNVL